jgi:ABC-type uncharacterized transport system auxiliary subunit
MCKRTTAVLWGLGIVALISLSGCLSPRQPAPMPTRYRLSYPKPDLEGLKPMPEVVLRVERFGAPPPIRDERIAYHETRLTADHYAYHRWISPPPDMVTHYLARDLGRSELFRAVYVFDDQAKATHAVRGAVMAFGEEDYLDRWEAVLEVSVILIRLREPDPGRQVVMQRQYRLVEKCATRSPDAVAAALSLAMRRFSAAVANDIRASIANQDDPYAGLKTDNDSRGC